MADQLVRVSAPAKHISALTPQRKDGQLLRTCPYTITISYACWAKREAQGLDYIEPNVSEDHGESSHFLPRVIPDRKCDAISRGAQGISEA